MSDEHKSAPERPESPWNDPVVEEIREIRRRLWKDAGEDVRRYVEQTRERVAELGLDRVGPAPSAGPA
jgi:hypothetical protein